MLQPYLPSDGGLHIPMDARVATSAQKFGVLHAEPGLLWPDNEMLVEWLYCRQCNPG